jgi:hypothetical protein
MAGGERERDITLVTLERSGDIGRIRAKLHPETSAAEMIGTSWNFPIPSNRVVNSPPDGGDPASLVFPVGVLAVAGVTSVALDDSPLLLMLFRVLIAGNWESLLVLGLLNFLPSFSGSIDKSTPIRASNVSSSIGLLRRFIFEFSIFSASSIIFQESLSSLLIWCSK